MLLFFIGTNVEAAKMSTSSPAAEKKEMKEEALNQLKPPKTAENGGSMASFFSVLQLCF